jgi:hypothetical protein
MKAALSSHRSWTKLCGVSVHDRPKIADSSRSVEWVVSTSSGLIGLPRAD